MAKARFIFIILMAYLSLPVEAQDTEKIIVHDPVMIRQADTYYLFNTGWGVSVWSSNDMKSWKKEKPVFEKPPQWALDEIEGYRGHTWAPDISYHNGLYYLYYSVSAFGKNTSCIGLATNKTLDSNDPDFKWTDHGKVIQSIPGRDLWNAIDPNLAFDDHGTPWLTFGSFWNGMKLVRMNDNLEEIAQPQEWHTISKRVRSSHLDDRDPGDGAVEAPFIFKKDGRYYLFVSFDYCCRGLQSNYKIMVGRSDSIQGPYLDKTGARMDMGGGSTVIHGNEMWAGVGHNSAYTFDGKDYLVFHGYDASDEGKPKLIIKEMQWDQDGWPVVRW